jgi:hypothetical protein
MQTTSGFTSSSQRVTAGKRASIEFTFQVAINISLGEQETADQRAAARDVVGFNVFVNGVSAIAADSQTVEHRNPECGEKVSIRRAADLRFAEIEIQLSRYRARFLK